MSGTISSQYLTSLLIIAPIIEGGLTIEVEGDLTSKPYLDLTLDEMRKFGVEVENQDYRRLVVRPQAYKAGDLPVEGDASAASYFAALATLNGGRIALSNLGRPPDRVTMHSSSCAGSSVRMSEPRRDRP